MAVQSIKYCEYFDVNEKYLLIIRQKTAIILMFITQLKPF